MNDPAALHLHDGLHVPADELLFYNLDSREYSGFHNALSRYKINSGIIFGQMAVAYTGGGVLMVNYPLGLPVGGNTPVGKPKPREERGNS